MAGVTLTPTGIRQDAVARLLAAATAAGEKVYDSREINYEVEELPAITVTSLGGTGDKWSLGSLITKHTERLAITGAAAGVEEADLAAARDDLEAEIIDALVCDPEWLASFESVERVDQARDLSAATGTLLGRIAIVVDLKYTVIYSPSTTGMSDLRTIWEHTETKNPAGANVSDRNLYTAPVPPEET